MHEHLIVPIGAGKHNSELAEIIANQEMQIQQMAGLMGTMAESIRACTQQMNALAREVHMLTKVTPAQAKTLNDAIRERAAEICTVYRIDGGEKRVIAEIRKTIRVSFGITGTRELPRGDWPTAMHVIQTWDDFGVMRKIREAMRRDME